MATSLAHASDRTPDTAGPSIGAVLERAATVRGARGGRPRAREHRSDPGAAGGGGPLDVTRVA